MIAPLRLDSRDYPKEHQGWLGKLFGSLNPLLADVWSAVNQAGVEVVSIVVDPATLPMSVSFSGVRRGGPAAVYPGYVGVSTGAAVGAAVSVEWRYAPTRNGQAIDVIGLPGLSSGTSYEVRLVIVGG